MPVHRCAGHALSKLENKESAGNYCQYCGVKLVKDGWQVEVKGVNRDDVLQVAQSLSTSLVTSSVEQESELTKTVKALMRQNKKLDAIALYRKKTRCSLKEARAFVEQFEDQV